MPRYRVVLEGRNFWLTLDDTPARVGFYTTRCVEAAGPAEAEHAAIDLLRAEGQLAPLNEPDDPPLVFVDEIEEVGPEEGSDEVSGFAFFADEPEANA
ncbi:MAG: hypothetical protein O9284_18780 [Steroidobacteraceae bacterium]|jgi:hypothetical protein|nr:hypothetical protein [Steroidobacteraceae bacterium]